MKSVAPTTSYRDLIRSVFAERAKRNPRYSLRQFAKQSGLAISSLVEVLNGKKNLSQEKAHSIGRKLGFESAELDYFCTLVQLESAKSPALKIAIQEKLAREFPTRQVFDLEVDHFRTIADWYHLPLLELLEVRGFEFTPKKIAAALGILPEEATNAIHRFERLGLLEKTAEGKYRKTRDRVLVTSAIPNEALRSHHRQMLELTSSLLEKQSPTQRIMRTENIVITPGQLERAREIAASFIEQLVALSNARAEGTTAAESQELYHLGIQFFPIAQNSSPYKGEFK